MVLYTEKIAILMAEKGLTVVALSRNCGISPPNLSAILRKGRCRPITAGKLATGLGVSVTEITREVR